MTVQVILCFSVVLVGCYAQEHFYRNIFKGIGDAIDNKHNIIKGFLAGIKPPFPSVPEGTTGSLVASTSELEQPEKLLNEPPSATNISVLDQLLRNAPMLIDYFQSLISSPNISTSIQQENDKNSGPFKDSGQLILSIHLNAPQVLQQTDKPAPSSSDAVPQPSASKPATLSSQTNSESQAVKTTETKDNKKDV